MMSSNLIHTVQEESHVRIDLSRYAANIRVLKAIVGPDREFMAVVKADAYGHGAIECGKVALSNGASHLAVARIWEGIRLRNAGIEAPILVLGGPNLAAIELAIAHNLTLTVGSEAAANAVATAAQQSDRLLRVHLKLDTGLHRYGLLPALAHSVASALHASHNVDLEGVYAHFSSADEEDGSATEQQIDGAHSMLDALEEAGIQVRYIHLPNSAATLSGMSGRSNLLRAGIATYGLAPSVDVPLPKDILPVMSVRSKLTRAFDLAPGEGVSYGLTYRSTALEPSATVPLGYADGLPRRLSNKGWFAIDGQRCPIRGRVCMDQTVIGRPGSASEGDEVLIVGDGTDEAMTIDDIAEMDDTINYEIATRFSARMPRLYVENGVPIGYDFPTGPIETHE